MNSVDQFRIPENLPVSPFVYKENMDFHPAAGIEIHGKEITLDSRDMAILALVNRHRVVTAYQVLDLLNAMGAGEHGGYGDLFGRMDRLSEAALLEKYEYSSGASSNRPDAFYKLGQRGGRVLSGKGIRPQMYHYLSSMDLSSYFRLLSVNQFLTKKQITENINLARSIFVPDMPEKYTIRPQGILQFEEKTYFLEAVRQTPGWEEALQAKLDRYDALFACGMSLNIRMADPTVILIAESAAHCRRIMERTERRTTDFLYTADDLVYTRPNECLYHLAKKPRSAFAALLSLFGRD